MGASVSHFQHEFPTKQLAIVALCRVAEPIAMCSVFPYVYHQVMSFYPPGTDPDKINIGFYTAAIIGIFALAQVPSSPAWGIISDRIGRKPCLILGLLGTFLSLLMYGFSGSMALAIFARALGGILSGNVGVAQTMVDEIAVHKEHKPLAFSSLSFVWAFGSIFGPALGGGLADPHKAWPNLVSKGSLFHRYPYLLPNVACSILVLLGLVTAVGWLEETHPDFKGGRDAGIELRKKLIQFICRGGNRNTGEGQETTPLLSDGGNLRRYNSTSSVESPIENADGFFQEKAQPRTWTPQVLLWIVMNGILSYHVNAFEHLFPMLLQAEPTHKRQWWLIAPTGLGFSSQKVGILYVVQGMLGLFIQLFAFPKLTSRFGIFSLHIFFTLTYPVVYFLTPYVVLFKGPYYWFPITLIVSFKMIWETCAFPVVFVLLSNSVQLRTRMGTVQGSSVAVAALAKATGPAISGVLFDFGRAHDTIVPPWFLCGLITIVGAILCVWLRDVEQLDSTESLFVDEPSEATAAAAAMAIPVAAAVGEGAHAVALLATSVQTTRSEVPAPKKDLGVIGITARELRYESDSSEDGGQQKMQVVVEEGEQSD